MKNSYKQIRRDQSPEILQALTVAMAEGIPGWRANERITGWQKIKYLCIFEFCKP